MSSDSTLVATPSASIGYASGLQSRIVGVRVNALTVALAAVTVTGFAAVLAFVGADARWLAALGHVITARHEIPTGVPFAAAPSAHWPNAIVLAELIFHALETSLGDRGLMLAQLLAVAVGTAMLARDALAGGASVQGTATALLLAAVGALPSLSVARAQLFSLALFPALLALLRSDARRPSRRIFLVLPLLAVWSNLHGAVLVGFGVTIIYLALHRFRRARGTAVAVGVAAPLALCLTPAGFHTIAYYEGVLTNQAAARGQGLWQPLSLSAPLDIVLIAVVVALAIRFVRSRPALWEMLASVALAAMTIGAARSGVWLLFLLVAPAARAFKARLGWERVLPALGTVAVALLIFAIGRGPLPTGAGAAFLSRAIALAHGTPVLAEAVEAEQVALAGGRIWIGNPIDAFSKPDQNVYLDWLQGKPNGVRALDHGVDVVLTGRRSAAQQLMARQHDFTAVASDRTVELYLRNRATPAPIGAA